MPTKYKYGKDGSYFDPETKRTYYKDPQYQKAYDDEWNRLEKLYRTRQEEQRKIEMANFQRVLAQADALRKSLRASGITPTPQPWTPYRNEFKKGGSTKSDEGYYEYMKKVAENNAAKWEMSEDEALLHLLNDPTYNYKAYYEANKANPNFDSDNHWPDTYKTAYHPTFSDESIYSGKQSQYNPNGEVGGSWVGNSDILYPSYMWNPEVAHYIEQGKEQVPWEQKNRFDGTENSEIEKGYKKDSVTVTPVDQLAEYLSGVFMTGIQSTGDALTLYNENLTSAISDGIDNIRKAAEEGKKNFDNEITLQDRRLLQAGTPQRTYLLPRKMQEKAFLQDGYIIGKEKDYGPLGPEVRKHAKPIPIYQTAPDAIDPSKLYTISGYYETDTHQFSVPDEAQISEPGNFPMQYFIDKSTGDLYQKGWDLNDYGVDSGGASSLYDPTYLKLAKLLDKLGSPTVITTGFQPVMNADNKPLNILDFWNDLRNNAPISHQIRDIGDWQSFLDQLSKIVTKNPKNSDEPLEAVLPVSDIIVHGHRKY